MFGIAMELYYCDEIALPLPAGHRFPAAKYPLLRQRVVTAGWPEVSLGCAPGATFAELALTHHEPYLRQVFSGELSTRAQRRIGLPWSEELLARARCSVGATVAACRSGLRDGIAGQLGGGTHHAFADRGEGYCIFNDAVVATRLLRREGAVGRVLIVDCDVHQGNGTAALCRDDSETTTFSIHGEANFPFRKEPSDLDIALPRGTTDEPYLGALEGALDQLLGDPLGEPTPEAARYDLAIYLAGADAWLGDRLGTLALSKAGLRKRDQLVLSRLRRHDIPVAVTLAGGYAAQLEDTVEIYFGTLEVARGIAERVGIPRAEG
jgi:acetoin utilization deacetylase AcuC-like enzyme